MPPIPGGKSAAPPALASASSGSSRSAVCVAASAGGEAAALAAVEEEEEEESLDSMMERLKDLHRKLKTGTAERTDAAELERLKRRYEAAVGGALRTKTESRLATRERMVEMRGKIETAARRKVTNCPTTLQCPT